MNIFLVGNGFDLQHGFPTRYFDFLQVGYFLTEEYSPDLDTVGKVLGNEKLHSADKYIEEDYKLHKTIYDKTAIQPDLLSDISKKAKSNMWFQYLHACINKDINWIDFETEISQVLLSFRAFFDDDDRKFQLSPNGEILFDLTEHPSNARDRYIISQFGFFFEATGEYFGRSKINRLLGEYAVEYPLGSGVYDLNTEKIISTLYAALRELVDLLKGYLLCFVEEPMKKMIENNITPKCPSLPESGRVVSFNYTNTFETLYNATHVDHIHGIVTDNIVLGINPDKDDDVFDIDTSFLMFKKYFQRTFFKTDISFLRGIKGIQKTSKSGPVELYAIGHSLDITDDDIIRKLFDLANKITVFYHSESSAQNLIRNLVRIYGKNEFDNLRESKELRFQPQASVEWNYQ